MTLKDSHEEVDGGEDDGAHHDHVNKQYDSWLCGDAQEEIAKRYLHQARANKVEELAGIPRLRFGSPRQQIL